MRNLQAEMKRKDISIAEIQKILKCSEKTVRNKINEKTEFSIFEAFAIKEKLFPECEIEYLFSKDNL